MTPDERLATLEREGAGRFDPEAHRLCRRLLDAGLDARASDRLDKLARALAAGRRAAREAIDALRARGGVVDGDLAASFEAGDFRCARRTARRALRSLDAGRHGSIPRWARAIAERAKASTARLPTELASRLAAFEARPIAPPEEARAIASALSRALFDEARATTRATVALARLADHVPEAAGPYNTHALAAHTLEVLATLSPEYVASYVAMLDDLASLDALDAPAPRAPTRRRR